MITHTEVILFKYQLLMIPNKLHEEMKQQYNVSHSGVGECSIRREIKEMMYWPCINKDI